MIVHVKNKLVSMGGSSSVINDNKESVFLVKGKWPSIRKRKYICNLDGERLFEVRNKFWHFLYPSAFIYSADGEKIAQVKKKYFSMKSIYLVEGTEHEYKLEGNFIGWNLTVYKDGQVIGKINRNFSLIRDAFTIDANESEMPFMIALVIAIDNMTDKNRKSSH